MPSLLANLRRIAPIPSTAIGCAVVVAACLFASCHDSGGDAATITVTPSARVMGKPLYVDRDGDGRVGAGDTVTVRFDRQVAVRSAPVAFRLAVAGDSFGVGAVMQDGDRPDEVRIVLGSGARLRARGRFADLEDGSASALSLPSTDAIVDRDQQKSAAADAARDLGAGFAVLPGPASPPDGEAIAAGDLDGDGDLDLVIGREDAGALVFTNDGNAVFVSSGPPLAFGRALALGDLDHDGDLDLVLGSDKVETSVWRNDGSGAFVQIQLLAFVRTESVALGDLDGDGDLDLVRGNGPADPDELWWNDGTGQFTAGSAVGDGNTHTVLLADVDGDGDLDLLQGRSGPSRIWHNDGQGSFTSGQAIGSGTTRALAAGDLDCDGDLDLVTAGRDPAEVWRNEGGTFTSTGRLANAATDVVLLLDFDGDGRLDVYAANANGQDDELWVVDANLVLQPSGLQFADGTTTGAVVGDFDRDGDRDVITVGAGEPARLLRSSLSAARGELRLVASETHLGEGPALHLAIGDFDRDGHADLVETMGATRSTAVWHGDGAGGFPERTMLATGGVGTAVGDVDRDGDSDLIETGPGIGVRLWRNHGAGFSGGPENLSITGGVGVVLHDLEADGDLDLLLLRGTAGPARLWLNDGLGVFTAAVVPLLPSAANAAVVADLDRDGGRDLLLATDLGVVLLRNDGSGAFPTSLAVGTATVHTLAAADVDGDGDVDLAVGSDAGYAIWRNGGGGAFSTPGPLNGPSTDALAFADLDGDGDLDLLRGGDGQDLLWRNDGGMFVLAPLALSAGPTTDFAVVDLDCDGDLDVVVADGSATGGLRVFVQR